MSPLVSIYLFTCKYRYDISHFVLSKLFLVKYVFYLLLYIMGVQKLFAPMNIILVIELIIMSANILLNIY